MGLLDHFVIDASFCNLSNFITEPNCSVWLIKH